MTRWLVEFGYDGTPFAGWAQQPGLRTVEGTILEALPRYGVTPAPAGHLDVASRTDRGVSARANALAVTSDLAGEPLLRVLNGVAPEMFFRRARRIPADFRVRNALAREYRYFLRSAEPSLARWTPLLARFVGRPIDARSFARGVPSGTPCWRELSGLELRGRRGARYLDIRARSFLWGMVRKIVAALGEVAAGRISEEQLQAALEGRVRLSLPLAPPDHLVLWQVSYPGRWEVTTARRTRAQEQFFTRAVGRAETHARILPNLGP